ncbi:MAG: type IV pilus twitching motility protein PilT [Gammaproteobacteria bacterium]|nr:type IV pilus twitching motility protein PilT [Gammaproteobacteria bacterium]
MEILELLATCVARGASDLHLSCGLPPMLRIDGDLEAASKPAISAAEMHAVVDEVAPGQADACSHDADFVVELPRVARFRVNLFQQSRGPAAVFRVVPVTVPTMAELDMGAVFRGIADVPHGLVIVTGATGSGKSTTLAAIVDYINASRHQHILTIEDPIEFVHVPRGCLVTQREVGRDCADFAGALRAALRQDPDVILIGEMRDREAIQLTLTAAETGHLVLATLHAPSAPNAVDRIVDVFPGAEKDAVRALLADCLQAVVAQTLVKRVDGGRVAAHEIMLATPAVRSLIREHKVAQLYSTIQTSAAAGMRTLDQSLKALVEVGAVSADTARAKARFP